MRAASRRRLVALGGALLAACGSLYELGPDGQVRWEHQTLPRTFTAYPLVAADGTVCGLTTFGGLVLLAGSR